MLKWIREKEGRSIGAYRLVDTSTRAHNICATELFASDLEHAL